MAKKKMGGLGKGLDLLFADLPETSSDDAAASTLPLREIEPDPAQPRKQFDDDALNQLADSITENGLLQPLLYAPKSWAPATSSLRASAAACRRLAELDEVPVIIKDVSDEQAAALALIENLQREDLNPIEVAEGCHQLIEKYGLTQETAAKKLGKSRSSVTNSLRLLALPQEVRHKVSEGILSAGHAKVLLGLPTQELMQQAAEEIEANGLNVRQTEALCKKLAKPAKPPKPKPDPFNRPKRAVEIEAALKEVTGSEVHVEYKDGKGSLKIDFYSDEMLQKFADLLGHYDPEAE